ncbi:hypothetical protein ANRL4_00865 [Anaerolineae bacterium]|nr:hypothetical protein ANRL4_00865 [Anaerolineae bacterium]
MTQEKAMTVAHRPSALGRLLGTGMMAVGGWILYSALAVNHNRDLPAAINAERRTFASEGAGVLSYYVDRAKGGRPLVLIHSINAAASAFEMRPLFEHYRGSRPVYALDLPGFGFSDRSSRTYTPDLYAQAIMNFLSTQVKEEKPVDVVALSLGAEFAAMAALRCSERVHSLSLISPSGFWDRGDSVRMDSHSATSNLIYRLLSFPLWGQALYDLIVTPASIRYFLKQSFEGEVDEDMVAYDLLTSHRPGAKNAPLYFVSGRLFTSDIRQQVYEKLTLPALVLYDYDPFVRFDALSHLQERHPNWRAVRIVPTRGLPHWEKLNETTAALDQFWASGS